MLGASRPQKRAVRQEFFDDYNNREEILKEMDFHREESPLDDAPYNDEVAEDQEAKKLEKDLDDKIRIQNLVDEETNDEDKTWNSRITNLNTWTCLRNPRKPNKAV